jgi:hypothetical protein
MFYSKQTDLIKVFRTCRRGANILRKMLPTTAKLLPNERPILTDIGKRW